VLAYISFRDGLKHMLAQRKYQLGAIFRRSLKPTILIELDLKKKIFDTTSG